MPTIKDRILIGIAKKQRVNNPKELQIDAGDGAHTVVHILWRLQKQGLIAFRVKRHNDMDMPTKISLTPKGKNHIKGLEQ